MKKGWKQVSWITEDAKSMKDKHADVAEIQSYENQVTAEMSRCKGACLQDMIQLTRKAKKVVVKAVQPHGQTYPKDCDLEGCEKQQE